MPEAQLQLERPRLLREGTDQRDLDRGRYQKVYGLSGPPGATLLQQVDTRIRFTRGDQALVAYDGSYLEYFQLDAHGETQPDTHDLVLRRDGWDLAAVRRLLRRHGLENGSSHESRLRCVKTFRLGLGVIEDAEVHGDDAADRAFGFLANGPAPVEACITIAAADGSGEQTILPKSPCPFGYEPAGRGRFLGDPLWIAREVLDYRFTTRTGRFGDDAGYYAASVDSVSSPVRSDP